MNTQNVLDFCSGGGGFSLSMSVFPQLKTVAFCENDPHAIAVLKKNFPGVPIIKDIHDVTTDTLQSLGIQRIDGIVGGWACQPHSEAGKRKASKDDRDLWPQVRRILREIQPRWAVFENVFGLLFSESGEFFKRIQWDLASLGHTVEWGVVPCSSVETSDGQFIGAGGVHRRERVWIITIANPDNNVERQKTCFGLQYQNLEAWAATSFECSRDDIVNIGDRTGNPQSLSEPVLCSGDDGIPDNLGGYLMRPSDLDQWLPFATIPTIQRPLRLSGRELKKLSPEDRAEYQQLCEEYRREYNRAIESLCEAEKKEYRQLLQEYQRYRKDQKQQLERYGNAIVPQVAAKVFARLIEILENQPCNPSNS